MRTSTDPHQLAVETIQAADERGISLRLFGGHAVRYLTPDFRPRSTGGQDVDFACVSTHSPALVELLDQLGYRGDERFNALYGHRQMYFSCPDGVTSADVIVDRLRMCHVLDFRDRIDRLPVTLDVTDLLLTKLQIVEQNEKDVHDLLYLLCRYEVRTGDTPGTIGLARFTDVTGDDWGWWRTVTASLDRLTGTANGTLRSLMPQHPPYDPIEQARLLRNAADETPKSIRWRLRSRVGEHARWYELPEEADH